MNYLNELREISRLGRIKIGLVTIVMTVVGLIMTFVTAIISLIGGVAIIFGSYKLVDLCEDVMTKIVVAINNKSGEAIVKILENEEEE